MLQWTADSAFRFFPLVEHEDFGLTLHPFDIATNKVLALVGRLEIRDWVDLIACHDTIQKLGYLAWAATGKDPGLSPAAIVGHAGRSARYSESELAELDFACPLPHAADLSRRWHAMLDEAATLVQMLPPAMVGQCVLDGEGTIFSGNAEELQRALSNGEILFHRGCLRGALQTMTGKRSQ
ncbi:MAG: hypothetical protein RLZZ303_3186 [Candidatus Hydrogenedentota bacterium]